MTMPQVIKLCEHEASEAFADFLDEVYGDIDVAGMRYPTSRVLADVDPIAYRCAFADWLDSENIDIEY